MGLNDIQEKINDSGIVDLKLALDLESLKSLAKHDVFADVFDFMDAYFNENYEVVKI